jgi:hypothetical protein
MEGLHMVEREKAGLFTRSIDVAGNILLFILAIFVVIPGYIEFRTTLEIVFIIACLLLILSKYLKNDKKGTVPYLLFLVVISAHLLFTVFF